MKILIEIYFERLSNFKRKEPVTVAVPFKKGYLKDVNLIKISDGQNDVESQSSVTASWDDGSVKWALIKFFAELDGKNDKKYFCDINKNVSDEKSCISVLKEEDKLVIDNGRLMIKLNNNGSIFNYIKNDKDEYFQNDIVGPILNDKFCAVITDEFKIIENGPVSLIVEAKGKHFDDKGSSLLDFIVNIQIFKDCDWIKFDYRIINKENVDSILINSLEFVINKRGENNRLISGKSNYRTAFTEDNEKIYSEINAQDLIYEANEHFPEVFYGTFFGAVSGNNGGICATVYQAHQNFPKAFDINKNKLKIQLVPQKSDINIKYYRGMVKNHTIYLHFYKPNTDKNELNLRSLQFQMPDRGMIDSDVYKQSEVFPDFFLDESEKIYTIENALTKRMDMRGKAYGILHWGDSPDMHYTEQGRGNGKLVWTNNEYDFPHTAMLMYARTPERRYFDYMCTAARHWMDIDVCCSSDDELRQGAQIIHSADHISGKAEISHEWVEGLFDYYHMTGDKFAYYTALGIGENIKKQLKLPKYHKAGEINARETGWALRALAALYIETNDEKWLDEAENIVSHFEIWEKKYGGWLAPYTDHAVIRVPFMISIAVGSLMRYYNIKPDDKIKSMILRAVEDMVDNCLLKNGLFYYKELPLYLKLWYALTILLGIKNI